MNEAIYSEEKNDDVKVLILVVVWLLVMSNLPIQFGLCRHKSSSPWRAWCDLEEDFPGLTKEDR